MKGLCSSDTRQYLPGHQLWEAPVQIRRYSAVIHHATKCQWGVIPSRTINVSLHQTRRMRVAAVGIGGAGGRIVERLWQDNERRETTYLGAACAVDTDTEALDELDALPADRRYAFGLSETNGTGTNGDRTSGTAAIEDERLEVRRAIDELVTSDIDAVVLVAGLAGGTGSGATAHIADALREVYSIPVYCLSVLPAGRDDDAAANTMQALRALESTVDGQILFDNEAWLGSGQTVESASETLNETIVARLGALFAAGEATAPDAVGQSVVDASEIINTLSDAGFTTLGYASQDLQTGAGSGDGTVIDQLKNRFLGDNADDVDEIEAYNAVETTLRRAVRGKLTAQCELDSADRALAVFAGPPAWLIRDAVTDGRRWLTEELQSPEVRSGDMPTPDRNTLSVLVVVSGVTELPRLVELKTLAEQSS
ncbi:cell division protein [Haloarcula marismortui ATCC 43049]|uniref:Tubulin-like protein CetZ n=2 Tax=Haloarcula marismortui (strain ATCC 43049 / DSM 3752 / JCM 8966 / VKM B-1809) TaxID=272569 RepID=Q5UW64_HALMA|nr:cell division protein [Haloarcula marismortui ATCC 43049]